MKTFMLFAASLVTSLFTWVTPGTFPGYTAVRSEKSSANIISSPNATLSGSRYTPGFYIYPDNALDVQTGNTCTGINNAATFSFYVADVPNRFTIYDNSGNLIYTSNWRGYANYPGPWGQSLSTPNTFSYSYNGSAGRYLTLRVETVVSNQPGYLNDYWSASF